MLLVLAHVLGEKAPVAAVYLELEHVRENGADLIGAERRIGRGGERGFKAEVEDVVKSRELADFGAHPGTPGAGSLRAGVGSLVENEDRRALGVHDVIEDDPGFLARGRGLPRPRAARGSG